MRLGGPARFMADVHTPNELPALYTNAAEQNIPVFILGGGSNVIAPDEGFDGLILRSHIQGFDIINETASATTIKIGAGENWDDIVRRTVEMNLTGIEAMSAIPGTAGASPVQNVGAYGQEIADTLQSLEAYDSQTGEFVTLLAADCQFSYRHSIFRGDEAGRYFITGITITLSKNSPQPPFYAAIQTYFDENSITLFTPQTIRDAVVAIRTNKLPDPKIHPNTGSFFKNAIVEPWQLNEIRQEFPDVPSYDMGDGMFKVPTGWLIEHAELKGQLLHGMRVHDKNALVLINESAESYQDLASARQEIIRAVRDRFRIEIEQEPLELKTL